MTKLSNDVEVRIAADVLAADTSITVDAPALPLNAPPVPDSGESSVLTLSDSLVAPTKIEIVRYTTVTDNGDGTLTIGGLTRGQEGTLAQGFVASNFAYQAATAGVFDEKTDAAEAAAAAPVQTVDGQTGAVDLAANYEPKRQHNLIATTDPTASDDGIAGYEVLSRWVNTNTGEIFVCLDATAGAAQWGQTTLTLDELGSAAVVDVGAGADQVPQNSDLFLNIDGGAAASLFGGSQKIDGGSA